MRPLKGRFLYPVVKAEELLFLNEYYLSSEHCIAGSMMMLLFLPAKTERKKGSLFI